MSSRRKFQLAMAILVLALVAIRFSFPKRNDPQVNPPTVGRQGWCMSEKERATFDREALFGAWRDDDGDCRNTRAEVLQSGSIEPVVGGCSIAGGEWLDPYTGNTIRHPKDLDIDHIVPLKEAWISGAWRWNKRQRTDYANDPSVLVAVSKHENRSKADKDPAEWLPPNEAYRREYAHRWADIKIKHRLFADMREREALRDLGVKNLPDEAIEGCVPPED